MKKTNFIPNPNFQIELKDVKYDIFWIAEKLRVNVDKVASIVSRLTDIGIISVDREGRFYRTAKSLRTPDNIFDSLQFEADILDHHEEIITQIKNDLRVIPRSLRDVTALTLRGTPEKLDKCREIIRQFQDDLMNLMEDQDGSEVYRLTVQLMPVTKIGSVENL